MVFTSVITVLHREGAGLCRKALASGIVTYAENMGHFDPPQNRCTSELQIALESKLVSLQTGKKLTTTLASISLLRILVELHSLSTKLKSLVSTCSKPPRHRGAPWKHSTRSGQLEGYKGDKSKEDRIIIHTSSLLFQHSGSYSSVPSLAPPFQHDRASCSPSTFPAPCFETADSTWAMNAFLTIPNSVSAISASSQYATKSHLADSEGDFATTVDFLELLQRKLAATIPDFKSIFPAGPGAPHSAMQMRHASTTVSPTHSNLQMPQWVIKQRPRYPSRILTIDSTSGKARPNVRVNGQILEELNGDREEAEIFDEALDRHIWSLSNHHLISNREMAMKCRTRPQEVVTLLKDLLQHQHAEEDIIEDSVEDDMMVTGDDIDDERLAEMERTFQEVCAISEGLHQKAQTQLEQSKQLQSADKEIRALKN
ncbi:hypothetical protein EW146_g1555 [Bondarzewia mesenterica]|uniref:Uncharacterized protein n=1 Tax=Bondarzewia mesenterica TaxID=1095465 RepID=A0A4S4M3I5_9AGAM|nr:hypothetical protein EW146_g1555 [Bondarzewia mesenterica]